MSSATDNRHDYHIG